MRLFAGRDAIGRMHDAVHIDGLCRATAQRGKQLRQRRDRMIDELDRGMAGHDGAIEQAVQHVLDFPAELAERQRADQPARSFQRVERAADWLERFEILDVGLPQRKVALHVLDFFLDFLDEDLADLVIDVLDRAALEAGNVRGLDRNFLFDLFLDLGPAGVVLAGFGEAQTRQIVSERFGRARFADDQIADVVSGSDLDDARHIAGRGVVRRHRSGLAGPFAGEIDVKIDARKIHAADVGVGRRTLGARVAQPVAAAARQVIAPARKLPGDDVERKRLQIALARRRLRMCRILCVGEAGGRVERRGFRADRLRRHDVVRRLRRDGRCAGARTAAAARHRPVAERFEAFARDVENALAVAALLARRFEVVLDRGERIGELVHLLGGRHAAVLQQFGFDEAHDAGHQLRRRRRGRACAARRKFLRAGAESARRARAPMAIR